MNYRLYIYMFIMAGVSYLIRVLPLTLIKKEIKNTTIRSFLYYVPYVTLSVMTFPAIVMETNHLASGIIALVVAILIAYKTESLFKVAIGACASVFIVELLIDYVLPLM